MTDQQNSLGPMPPPPQGIEEVVLEEQHENVGPSRVLDHNGESNQSDYVRNLEAEVQGMRERIAELESNQLQQNQSVVHPTEPIYSMPPPIVRPVGVSVSLPQFTNQVHSTNPFANATPFNTVPRSEPKQCTYKAFLACQPPLFEGSIEPSVTMNWLRSVEKKFGICKCEPELQVLYTSQLLRGDAMNWWDTVTPDFTEEQIKAITVGPLIRIYM